MTGGQHHLPGAPFTERRFTEAQSLRAGQIIAGKTITHLGMSASAAYLTQHRTAGMHQHSAAEEI